MIFTHKSLTPTGVFLLLAFFFSTSLSAAPQPNLLSPLGINTNEAMEIDASVPFVDLFRMSLPFHEARPWLTKGKVEYDKFGWPKKLNGGQAGTRFVANMPQQSIPVGTYTVLYKGKGKIKYGGNARLIRHYPGKDVITLRGNKGKITGTLIITETDPDDYIRDIQVIMPGGICKNDPFRHVRNPRKCSKNNPFLAYVTHAKKIVFNPDYLTFMKKFRVIRLMNMAGITRNNLATWDKRATVEQSTWGGKEGRRGIPLEIMVQLANTIGIDPWFNLPHRANDEFIHKYARYISENLDPKLKAYVEYTNEAWNGIFSQTHYIQRMGAELGLDKNKAYAGYKFFSKRSVEIFKIWEQEFNGVNRIVRVMGGMATNVPLTHMLLGYEDAYKHVDSLAIAPYFHATQTAQKKIDSINSVFELLRSPNNKYSVPNTIKIIRNQAKTAARYGVELIAYEGGQHLVAYRTHTMQEGPNAFLIKANKDDRMGKLYYEFLEGWKKAGGKLFVAFSAPRSYNWIGSWGIKEYITQDAKSAPKYRGLMYFQTKNRCWWHGCTRIGGITRMSKPPYNPGASVMEKRFKPRLSEEKIKATSTTILVANAQRQRKKVLDMRKILAKKRQQKQVALRIRKAALQKKKDELFLQKAAIALFKEEQNQNPVFSF
ncbi:MAG TPA: hypothetical protein ENJ51_03985 [Leucothrix mucor]|uniref:Uncharacterized protein n=1 Tax=Leucothrix mucor TaxID=45248 RepID=A0A7V2SYT2_LEUMU|nr:hypothetical protein [Leucothrix mucor]